MTRNDQAENVLRGQHARAACGATIRWEAGRVAARETLECAEARDEVGIERSCGRQRVRIRVCATRPGSRREESTKAPGSSGAEGHRKERCLERELIRGADVFTHVVDAVAGANGRGVMAKEVVRHSDARADA